MPPLCACRPSVQECACEEGSNAGTWSGCPPTIEHAIQLCHACHSAWCMHTACMSLSLRRTERGRTGALLQESLSHVLPPSHCPAATTRPSRNLSSLLSSGLLFKQQPLHAVKMQAPPASLIFFSAVSEKNLALTAIGCFGSLPLPRHLKIPN